jgi:hypothetical protein
MASQDDGLDVAAAREFLRRANMKRQSQIARWGEDGPPINTVVKGRRIVASYNQLLQLSEDASYHDFLGFYIKHALGEDWWSAEAQLPDQRAHQLILWQRKVQEFQLKHWDGAGIQGAPIKGMIGHYYRIAFDLHTLRHKGLLQERLLNRLRNRGNFQGARYEMAVCAAFVRAGFDIQLEDESQSPHKVCELVATHRASGASYAVEAKSRHVPGVLGHPRDRSRRSDKEPRVSSAIKDALKKVAAHPRVICVDVNYPVPKEMTGPLTWGPRVRRQLNALAALGRGPAVLIFTNLPHHYLHDDELVRGSEFMIMGLNEEKFDPRDFAGVDRNFPGLVRAANMFGLAIPGEWE